MIKQLEKNDNEREKSCAEVLNLLSVLTNVKAPAIANKDMKKEALEAQKKLIYLYSLTI